MPLAFLFERFAQFGDRDAVVWKDRVVTYAELTALVDGWSRRLAGEGIAPGTSVAIDGDFSPSAIALLLALVQRACILVPLSPVVRSKVHEYRAIAEVAVTIRVDGDDRASIERHGTTMTAPLLLELRRRRHPGLVVFSSGSTGQSKAAVHDVLPLLEKFKRRRAATTMLLFLQFDHLGGLNTLFHGISNGGTVVIVPDRSPTTVCRAIARHRVQVLPASPTFLNLILVGEAYREHDLTSLSLVTYGTEPMPESTLRRFHAAVPGVRLQQTYGLSELGVFRSKSKASDSLWVKIGGEGVETRVVDGLLEIRAASAMLGYLNAPSPFIDDGWFQTGDVVEVDGEYLRILGRKSDVINVGGHKVFPAEVEGVLQLMDGVDEAIVTGEPHVLVGQIVTATVTVRAREPLEEFRRRMRLFCGDKLPAFKIPQKIVFADGAMHSGRFKKLRANRKDDRT